MRPGERKREGPDWKDPGGGVQEGAACGPPPPTPQGLLDREPTGEVRLAGVLVPRTWVCGPLLQELEVGPGTVLELRGLAGPGGGVSKRTAGRKNGQQGRACERRGLEPL